MADLRISEGLSHDPYPAGLLLTGRRVVLVGAGRVACRRLPALLDAGARVLVIAPRLAPRVAEYALAARISVHERSYGLGDLTGAWYAMALTDDPEVNAAVVAEAEDRQIFCVRADDARQGSAWTPATGRDAGLTVAVLAGRNPRRAARTRDALMDVVRDGATRADG